MGLRAVTPLPAAPGRFGVVDVHYIDESRCRAGLVVASDLSFSTVVEQRTAEMEVTAPYEPGRLFERELPPIRAVLGLAEPLGLLVVDGYVTLDPVGRAGLGARAHEAFGIPVIGVAKTAFRTATHAIDVRRHATTRPLHVTAIGMNPAEAARLVEAMSGSHRLPDAVKLADRLARGAQPPGGPVQAMRDL